MTGSFGVCSVGAILRFALNASSFAGGVSFTVI